MTQQASLLASRVGAGRADGGRRYRSVDPAHTGQVVAEVLRAETGPVVGAGRGARCPPAGGAGSRTRVAWAGGEERGDLAGMAPAEEAKAAGRGPRRGPGGHRHLRLLR